ncbi:MAG: ATP-dependent helicase [Candidatus Pacearchaeota archaeon]
MEIAVRKSEQELLNILDPLVREWFFSHFKEFSEPQLYGVVPIYERKNILISAPTGGTKTLTAFLSIINYLVILAKKNELEDKVYCIYTSPLKALANDILVNLINPLKEINEIAKKKGIMLQEIRVSVRTGDTTIDERQKMLKKVPHILITTPETLAIILNSIKLIEKLSNVEFLIVDEIHALASNKRGVHLSLSIERLNELSMIKPVRIGLSATIAPLKDIASYLVGYENGKQRECLIADIHSTKKIDLKVITPVEDLIDSPTIEQQKGLYELLDKLIQEHKTTLIFTNTRSATERVINHLKERFPSKYIDNIGAHHSSLSKEFRFKIEEKLRKGELKVVVTSTSLELGIDIGYIDLVIMLGSPKSVARALQRTGRAGHRLHEVSKGRFVVLDRDDLVECAVMLKEAKENKIDSVQIPKNCLDVLSQQIYGMAISKVWHVGDMLRLIRQSYCYHDLKTEDFYSVISYLSGEYALNARNVYAKIWFDSKTGMIGKKGKLARAIYMTNVGTIPEESFVNVIIQLPVEKRDMKIGVIDEGFLERLKRGDVFVLGGHKYEFLYAKGMNAYVNASVSKSPNIPSWFSEMLPLSFDLAMAEQRFRKLVAEKFEIKKPANEIIKFISNYLYVDEKTAEIIYSYFYEQFRYSKIPHLERLLIEYWNDGRKNYAIFHSLFGRRINDALSRALAYVVGRFGGRDIEIGINDNGFYLASQTEMQVERAIHEINSKNLRDILEEAISKTEVFKRRFRHCATRALMLLRNYKGHRKSVGKQQMSSHFLLTASQKASADFPILKETKREIMNDLMDLENAKLVLDLIKEGKIKIEILNKELPSPFSLGLIIQGHTDLMRIEDKIEFLKRMHKEIIKKIE